MPQQVRAVTPPHGRIFAMLITAILSSLLASACSEADDRAIAVSVIDSGEAMMKIGRTELSPAGRQMRMDLAQGLVRYDAEGNIIPGLAQSWVVTDDGLSYIFRLKDREWSNGSRITAQAVTRGLNERIEIERGGRFAAEMIKVRDVIARTRQVVEFRLEAPSPNFLNILALPEMGVRTDGLGTGPLMINGDEDAQPLDLRLMPDALDMLGEPGTTEQRRVFVSADRAALAIQKFSENTVDIVLGGRFQHLPLINVSTIARSRLQLDPVSGLFGLAIANDEGFLSTPGQREALAMAIDRTEMFSGLQVADWTSTTRLIPENILSYEPEVATRWTDLTLAERRERARLRVLVWERANGIVPPLRVAMPKGPGARYLMARLRADWQLIGISAEAVDMDADADLRLIDEVAPYNAAEWYLGRLSCTHISVCDEEADFLLQDARAAYDAVQRTQGIARAETMMTLYNNYIPLGLPLRWSLVRGEIPGYAANPTALHPLSDLLQDPI